MRRNYLSIYIVAALAGMLLASCGPTGPDISIKNIWVRPDPLWENAAGYFLIVNDGDEADYLIEVRADFAGISTPHKTVMEGDVHKMLPAERVEIPAGGYLEFKTMSYHVMLMGLDAGLELGQEVMLVLVFEKSGEIEVQAELRQE